MEVTSRFFYIHSNFQFLQLVQEFWRSDKYIIKIKHYFYRFLKLKKMKDKQIVTYHCFCTTNCLKLIGSPVVNVDP